MLKVVEVLNPLAREYKSIGTMKKELAELQDELSQAHRQVSLVERDTVYYHCDRSYIELDDLTSFT